MGEPASLAHQPAPQPTSQAAAQPTSQAAAQRAPVRGSLPADRLARLNERRNRPGLLQLSFHLSLLLAGGLLWAQALGQGPLAASGLSAPLVLPLGLFGLLLLGWGLAFAFCAMHEAGHRTAFASRAHVLAWIE